SPAYSANPNIESIKSKIKELRIGGTFGVDTNRSGDHEFDSMDVNREIGAFVEEKKDAEVDLEDPETWVKIDVRKDNAFIYKHEFKGPDGFPVGIQGEMAALISGGIDSPVAAYEIMKRGADIKPLYFYNKPISAEDHLLRFRSILEDLKKFHPGKKWNYFVVNMKEINEELMQIDSGRMILHRRIMFKIAGRIADKKGLKGIVTGESLGQKSSQTAINLQRTTEAVNIPVYRPLLTWNKSEITEEAREIGTVEKSNIDSACATLSPDEPATELKEDQLEEIEKDISVEKLVENAVENCEENLL
ncbi:MAG: tRNA 4-thiouridine(8) synthase ThiI, partial [Nanohaloarchaea archaeon SW_4_43_9]